MTTGKIKKVFLMGGLIISMSLMLKSDVIVVKVKPGDVADFKVVKPGDLVVFTVEIPGATIIEGHCNNPGGFEWSGRYGSWNGTVLPDSPAQHNGNFSGKYVFNGTGNGQQKIYDWGVTTKATVVKVGKIGIYAEGGWHDVTDQEIVLLKGSKYTFKAIPDQENVSFPAHEPTWSGIKSDSGNPIEVTFDSAGTFTLNAKCGKETTGKDVDIIVICPRIEEVRFKGQDILDKTNMWTYLETNDPACFVQNRNTTVEVIFHGEKSLTYNTDVKVYGGVDWWDYMTGGNYSETATTFKDWPSTPLTIQSERTTDPEVNYSNEEVDIAWQYKVPTGTNNMVDADHTSNLDYYLIWNDQKAGTEFKFDLLRWACMAAEDTAGEDNIREDLNEEIYAQYVYETSGNCHQLASNFIWSSKVLGIDADAVMWTIPWSNNNVGDMIAMEPEPFIGAGGTDIPGDVKPPPNPSNPVPMNRYCWSYHQWAQSGSKQYDPSAGKILNGGKEAYEDISMKDYAFKQNLVENAWVGTNHPGQSVGCESTGLFSITPPPDLWMAP